jgi:hypothetical protein
MRYVKLLNVFPFFEKRSLYAVKMVRMTPEGFNSTNLHNILVEFLSHWSVIAISSTGSTGDFVLGKPLKLVPMPLISMFVSISGDVDTYRLIPRTLLTYSYLYVFQSFEKPHSVDNDNLRHGFCSTQVNAPPRVGLRVGMSAASYVKITITVSIHC